MAHSYRGALRAPVLMMALSFGLAAPWAQAQDSGRVEAEALFDAGLDLMRRGKFTEACTKLEDSQRIAPGVGTLLYLAECYEFDGRIASAWATFREAAAVARARGQEDRARAGTERADKLEPRLSRVTLEVAPENRDIEGLTIRRGDVVVSASTWDTPLPVDPGQYEVVVTAPGYESLTLPLEVGDNADQVVLEVPPLQALPTQPTPQPVDIAPPPDPSFSAQPTEDAPSPPRGKRHRQAAWVATGVGVVGVGVGSAFGLVAMSRNNEAKDHCEGSICRDEEGETLTDEAQNAATWSNVGFGVGIAGAAAATVLWLTAPKRKVRAVQLSPTFENRGAALSVRGRF